MNKLLKEDEKIVKTPKCQILNECLYFDCSNIYTIEKELEQMNEKVVIDLRCAQAVLRGADIFVPGIISLSISITIKYLI